MITGVILTHNEEGNIRECIEHLRPHVAEIILIDTCSTDRTLELAIPLVDKVLHHPHVPNFDSARNLAIPVAKFDWLWFVDADEFIPLLTGECVQRWIKEGGQNFEAINIPFKTYFCGKWMQHCGWWPGYTSPRVLKRGSFEFSSTLHGGVSLAGREILAPATPDLAVEHRSFRDLSHWIEKCNRYTSTEAKQLADRGTPYDWRAALRFFVHDLWEHYEKNDARLDGERGWILTFCCAFYRWASISKLIDLGCSAEQPGEIGSVPKSLEEVLDALSEELAFFRKELPWLPLGVVVRANFWLDAESSETTRQIAVQLAAQDRPLAIESTSAQVPNRISLEVRTLLRALERCRRAKSVITLTCAPAMTEPDRCAVYNVLYIPSDSELQPDQAALIDRYDEVWVETAMDAAHWTTLGVAPERIKTIRLFTAQGDSGVSVCTAPIESVAVQVEKIYANQEIPQPGPSQIKVELQGQLFAGSSFSNINEELAIRLASEPDISLAITRVRRGGDRERLTERVRELVPSLIRRFSTPDVTIRHAFPPNWQRPVAGLWVHIQPWEFGWLPKDWVEPIRRDVDEVWVMSRYVESIYIRSGVQPEKLVYIPWGVDESVFHPGAIKRKLPTKKTFRFLFVGGTIPRKGFDRLLDAYLAEFSYHDDVCLVVKDCGSSTFYRGESMTEHIRKAQQSRSNPEILLLTEDCTPGQLAGLYSSCNCLVAPYRGEGFCLPVLEAMACGVPAIVPRGGPTDDFVSDSTGYCLNSSELVSGHTGDLVGPATELHVSIADIRSTMRQAFENRLETERLGQAGSRFVRSNFTWTKTVALMTDRIRALKSAPTDGGHSVPTAAEAHSIGASKMTLRSIGFNNAEAPQSASVPAHPGLNAKTSDSSTRGSQATYVNPSHYGRLGKGLLIQMASGDHLRLLAITRDHHRQYANHHGMDYWDICGSPALGKRAHWGKIPLMLTALAMGYEHVIWLDADAVITRVEVNLSKEVKSGIGMVRHPSPEHWNTGLIINYASEPVERFWQLVEKEAENESAWAEQLAVNQLAAQPEFSGLFQRLDTRFNSIPELVPAKNPVIVATHGLPFLAREAILQQKLGECCSQAVPTQS